MTTEGRWIALFICIFAVTAHMIACFWIITAQIDPSTDNWVHSVSEMPKNEVYMTSFYFTITTMTTVGYGDWSATTFTEKIVCTFIMFIGVICFSFASGALANYIERYDDKNDLYKEKLDMLDKLYNEYVFPIKLYADIRKILKSNYKKDLRAVTDFVEDLPLDMKQ